MTRDWDLKKQAEIAKQSFEQRDGWMKELSHFVGKEKSSTSSGAQSAEPGEAVQASEEKKAR